MRTQNFITFLSTIPLIKAQAVGFCTDDKCATCKLSFYSVLYITDSISGPSSITTAGTGYPECVIYDTETVFAGQGFEVGEGNIHYKVHGNFPDPGPNCNLMIRSPASLTTNGCGNLIQQTNMYVFP